MFSPLRAGARSERGVHKGALSPRVLLGRIIPELPFRTWDAGTATGVGRRWYGSVIWRDVPGAPDSSPTTAAPWSPATRRWTGSPGWCCTRPANAPASPRPTRSPRCRRPTSPWCAPRAWGCGRCPSPPGSRSPRAHTYGSPRTAGARRGCSASRRSPTPPPTASTSSARPWSWRSAPRAPTRCGSAARPRAGRSWTRRPVRCSGCSAPRCTRRTGRPGSRCHCDPTGARSKSCCGATRRPCRGTART